MRPMTRIEAEMAQYPETGIVNPFINTKLCLTQEMVDFFNGYLLEYRDYPDSKIAREFSDKFEFTKDGAKEIEHAYVVVNRERIYKRIKNLHKRGKTTEAIVEQMQIDFGLNEVNAEKYVRRCMMDGLDSVGGCLIQEDNTSSKQILKSMDKVKIDGMSEKQLLEEGLKALEERLGIVGTIRFLQQFDNGGSGDYTKEKYDKENEPAEEEMAKLLSEWLAEGEDTI